MSLKYASMRPFMVRCQFWHPTEPDIRIPGTVGFNGTDILLFGDANEPSKKLKDDPVEVLHAETVDGKDVTVFDCFLQRWGSKGSRFVASMMGVGSHLDVLQKQRFNRAVGQIQGIQAWWTPSQIQIGDSKDGITTVTCSPPKKIEYDVTDRSVIITLGQSAFHSYRHSRFCVDYKNCIQWTPQVSQTYEWFNSVLEDTRQLITLLMGQNTTLFNLKLYVTDGEEIEWFWNRESARAPKFDREKVLVSFDDIAPLFESVIKKWLTTTDAIRHARNLFFSHESMPAPYLENKFMPVVQALEVFGRVTETETYIAKQDFDDLKSSLLKSIPERMPEGLLNKLRSSIGHSNEMSLGDRVFRMMSNLDDDTRACICDDAKKFKQHIIESRNYYTHYGDYSKHVVSAGDLYWLTSQATLLLRVLMLKSAGVPEEMIKRHLSKSRYYTHYRNRWSEIEQKSASSSSLFFGNLKMIESRYPEFTVAGSPREMGRQFGDAARELIRGFAAAALERVNLTLRVSKTQAENTAAKSLEFADKYSPDSVEELRGMAEAAGLSVTDLMILQVRNQLQNEPEAGCTSFSLAGATGRGRLLAQNWDNDPGLDPFTCVLTRKPVGKPALLNVTQAGLISYIGLNDAGMGVCLNTLPAPSRPLGVPHYFQVREIYEATSLAGAIHAVTRAHRAIPANIMLTTPDGPADLEVTIDAVHVLRADEHGRVTHTNHCRHPALANINANFPELIQSQPRQERIDRLLAAGENSVERLKSILRNHEDHPRSICRHANADPGVGHWQTVFSVIIDPDARRMHVSRGTPCVEPYEVYELP